MFRFLHAADIHLDSPLKSLEAHDGAPVEEVRGATRRAFENLINLAIREKVAFVLLAGDLYDGTWKDYNTGLFFLGGMRKLRDAGIRVFLVSGNHDAASRITGALRLPENVVQFSSRKAETSILEEHRVVIHGQSYATRAVRENLSLAYPEPDPHYFNIGLLHTALSGRPGHEPYAPCTMEDLIAKGYDYWALGHVHQREEVCTDPWIVFPGNLQGRHIREAGPKGASLVTVGNGRVSEVSHRVLDVVRWSSRDVDCSACVDPDEVLNRVRSEFVSESGQAGGRPLAMRIRLTGRCAAHDRLLRDEKHFRSELLGLAIDTGDIWLEKIKFATRRSKDFGMLEDDSPLAGLMHSIGNMESGVDALAELTTDDLQKFAARLPSELLEDGAILPEDPEQAAALIAEVREMLLARILNRTGS